MTTRFISQEAYERMERCDDAIRNVVVALRSEGECITSSLLKADLDRLMHYVRDAPKASDVMGVRVAAGGFLDAAEREYPNGDAAFKEALEHIRALCGALRHIVNTPEEK